MLTGFQDTTLVSLAILNRIASPAINPAVNGHPSIRKD